ncbi:sodium- and chloride-dependent GABA transporter 2-like [Clavelina lepadiformis]|uniref:sodium- and chloride-dependent GABA transporter 2-like n=1 Tax=Clavelina lepadiformis TaxID=159417 RepID=UPI00404276C8
MSGTNSRQVSWSRSWDFMFATAGWSIGLGNIWRFPYLCYQYGGGAFLIPYIFFGFVFALPCLMLEASLGQMVRKNLIDTWRSKVPVFTGIAYANMVMSFLVVIHYVTLLVWIVKYFVASFSTILPWISCNNTWNDERCVDFTIQNKSELFGSNQLNGTRGESAAEQYWKLNVLKISSGINEVGSLQLDLMAYSALVWLLIYLSTFKGIKFSAKVSYITATLPAILIVVMVILGLTLDGSMAGISHYLRPDISKLADFEVWLKAASQTGYSVGSGYGIMLALRSHNKYNDNFYRDCMLIVMFNMLTSFVSGFAVFSNLGFVAHKLNTTIDAFQTSGPGLVFLAYPQSLSLLPLPQLWCALLFLMLFFLGFDTQFIHYEFLVSLVFDLFPQMRGRYRYAKEIFNAMFCVVLCLISWIFLTESGPYLFEIFNQYSSVAWSFFIICGCELVAVAWFSGAKKHCQLIKRMIGPTRTENVIIFFWKYFTPAWCLALAAYSIVFHKALTYGNYVYPPWAQAFAHTLSFSSFVWIPGFAIYLLLTSKKTKAELLGRGSQCSNNDDGKEFDEVDKAQIELQCTKLVESSVA